MTRPVVLLHGLARTHRSMAGLHRELSREGFATWACTYPSRRATIAASAAEVAARIREALPDRELDAVTHSMGGILVRHMPDLPFRRIVMLAPPNQGSRLARSLGHHPLFRWFYGPAGQQMSTPEDWPLPTAEVAVIAGTRGLSASNPTSWALHPLGVFDGVPSDGTVAVEETRLPTMAAFATVDATHTWIMDHPRARALTIEFLRTGKLGNLTTDN